MPQTFHIVPLLCRLYMKIALFLLNNTVFHVKYLHNSKVKEKIKRQPKSHHPEIIYILMTSILKIYPVRYLHKCEHIPAPTINTCNIYKGDYTHKLIFVMKLYSMCLKIFIYPPPPSPPTKSVVTTWYTSTFSVLNHMHMTFYYLYLSALFIFLGVHSRSADIWLVYFFLAKYSKAGGVSKP